MRIQGRHEHERVVEVLLDALAVRLDTDNAVLAQTVRSIGQEANALQEVVDMSGLKTLSSKLPDAPPMLMATSLPITCAASIVTASDWWWIHLARHDRAAGLVLRNRDLAEAATGPDASQRMSLAILLSDAASV